MKQLIISIPVTTWKKMMEQWLKNILITDYEFDVKSVDDIENKRFKDEIISLYRSIDDYTEQKTIMDDKLKVRDKQRKKGWISEYILYFCNHHKV